MQKKNIFVFNFSENLIATLCNKYKSSIDTLFVFPNNRSKLEFKKKFFEINKANVDVVAIQEIKDNSLKDTSLFDIDKDIQLLLFYKIFYENIEKINLSKDTFFSNLNLIKEIWELLNIFAEENLNWNIILEQTKYSKYNELISKIKIMHEAFCEFNKNNSFNNHLAFEKKINIPPKYKVYNHYVLVNFFYLRRLEINLINELTKDKSFDLIFYSNKIYSLQEKLIKNFSINFDLNDFDRDNNKIDNEIYIKKCKNKIEELAFANYVFQIEDKLVYILPNEKFQNYFYNFWNNEYLIFYPEEKIIYSKIYDFLKKILLLKINEKKENDKIYYKLEDIISIYKNEVFIAYINNYYSGKNTLEENIDFFLKNKIKFVESTSDKILPELKDIMNIFIDVDFYSNFEKIINNLQKSYKCNFLAWNKFYEAIIKFKALESKIDWRFSEDSWNVHLFNFILEYLANIGYKIEDNKKENAAILYGIQEIRNLNFDSVFISNFNENFFPENKRYVFLPDEFLINLGVLSPKEEREIWEYYWEQILNSTKKIYISYIDNEDYTISSFVKKFLYKSNNYKLIDEIETIGYLYKFEEKKQIINEIKEKGYICNTQEFIDYLHENGLSATYIRYFLECPYKFYLKYFLKIEEITDESKIEFDYLEIGNISHNILNKIFNKNNFDIIINKKLDREKIKETINEELDKRNALIFNIIDRINTENYLLRIIDKIYEKIVNDYKNENWCILHTEYGFSNFRFSDIPLKGKIDRIDVKKDNSGEEKIRIIDYKSGNILTKKRYDIFSNEVTDIQLPLYALIYNSQENKVIFDMILWQLNDESIKEFSYSEKNLLIENYFENFSSFLKEKLNQMKDINFKFEIKPGENCNYCIYENICRYKEI